MTLEMPCDLDAEKSILGSVLCDNTLLPLAMMEIEPDDFYAPIHAVVYMAICRLRDSVINSITIREKLSESEIARIGDLDDVLIDCSALAVGRLEFVSHCQVVLEYSIRRGLLRVFSDAQGRIKTGEKSSDVISAVASEMMKLNRTRQPVRNLQQIIQETLALLEESANREPGECNLALAVPTGLRTIDRELTAGGIRRGLICSVAAESSKGKSALGVTVCKGAAMAGQKVLVISFEDSDMSVALRLMSQESGIENQRLQGMRLEPEDWPMVTAACSKLWDCQIEFMDPCQVDQCCQQVLAENLRKNYDLILWDYLQMIPSGLSTANRQQQIDYAFAAINLTARQLKQTATVLISQLRRIHGRRPSITDLYHSGQIEQGSRTVMLIWDIPALDARGARVVDIAKQAQGGKGQSIVGWREENVLFYDISEEKQSELAEVVANAKKADDNKD